MLGEPSESEIELAICRFLSAQGLFVYKTPTTGYFDPKRQVFRKQSSPFAINGIPDLTLIYGGARYRPNKSPIVVFLEVKSKKGKLTDAQISFQKRIYDLKGHYYVVRSVDDMEGILNALKTIP